MHWFACTACMITRKPAYLHDVFRTCSLKLDYECAWSNYIYFLNSNWHLSLASLGGCEHLNNRCIQAVVRKFLMGRHMYHFCVCGITAGNCIFHINNELLHPSADNLPLIWITILMTYLQIHQYTGTCDAAIFHFGAAAEDFMVGQHLGLWRHTSAAT